MHSVKKFCVVSLCSILCSMPVSAVKYTVRVDDDLIVRKSPTCCSEFMGSLSNNSQIDVLEIKNGWGQIDFNGNIGWICLKYAVPLENNFIPRQYVVRVDDDLIVRKSPTCCSEFMGSLSNNSQINVLEIKNGWGQIDFYGNIGWVCLKYAVPLENNFIPRQYVVRVDDALRLRERPTINSEIAANLSNGTVLKIVETSENWGKTTYNGKTGWVCMDFLVEMNFNNFNAVSPVNFGTSMVTQEYLGQEHRGIDIGSYGCKNIDIFSIKEGMVIEAVQDNNYNGGMGNYVVIKHSDNFISKYMHFQSVCVQTNEYVSTKQKIGVMGNTGRSTGVHLHLQVEYKNNHMDPRLFINPIC